MKKLHFVLCSASLVCTRTWAQKSLCNCCTVGTFHSRLYHLRHLKPSCSPTIIFLSDIQNDPGGGNSYISSLCFLVAHPSSTWVRWLPPVHHGKGREVKLGGQYPQIHLSFMYRWQCVLYTHTLASFFVFAGFIFNVLEQHNITVDDVQTVWHQSQFISDKIRCAYVCMRVCVCVCVCVCVQSIRQPGG